MKKIWKNDMEDGRSHFLPLRPTICAHVGMVTKDPNKGRWYAYASLGSENGDVLLDTLFPGTAIVPIGPLFMTRRQARKFLKTFLHTRLALLLKELEETL